MAHLERQSKNVLYFPFSSTDPTRQTMRQLVCTLIWQALLAQEDDMSWNIVHSLMAKGPPTPSELWLAFASILKSCPTQVFLIIDGADECSELDELLEGHISQLLLAHSNLSATVIGRQRILQHCQAVCSSKVLRVTPSDVKEDIEAFIKSKINQFPILQLNGMREKVFKTLRKQSEGMFLWVRLMIDDLRKSSNAAELSFRLASLPRGLLETYQHIIRRLYRDLEHDPLAIDIVRSILAFTIICRRQMTFSELRYALALDSMLRSKFPGRCIEDFLPQYSAEQLQDMCGNLITISNDGVGLVHFSLKEFLTQSEEEGAGESGHPDPRFRVDLDHTHRRLAAACIRYLGLDNYGLPWQDAACLPIKQDKYPFLECSSKHVLFHISSSGSACSILENAITKFVKSERCVSWVEYFFLDMADDLAFTQVLQDFDEFSAWLLRNGRAEEIFGEVMTMLSREMNKRLQHANDKASTERWALFMTFAQDHIPTFLDTEVSQPRTQETKGLPNPCRISAKGQPPASAQNMETLARRTMGLVNANIVPSLKMHFQMDIVLIVRNITTTARVLTDSLELLFQLILRKANWVPVHALLHIAAFYNRVGHEERAILVTQTALKRMEGADTELEFDILHRLGQAHDDRGMFDEAVTYYEKEVAGRTRGSGEMNYATIGAKFSLGVSLCESHRSKEAEAVLLPLQEASQSLTWKDRELLNLFRWRGVCQRRLGNPRQAITILMNALNLHVTMDGFTTNPIRRITYEIGCSWHDLKEYDQAIIWYEKALKPNEVEETPNKPVRYEVAFLKAVTFYDTGKWDECLESLRLSLSDLQDPSNFCQFDWKGFVLRRLFNLGRIYFSSASFPRSYECFQLMLDELARSPKLTRSTYNLENAQWIADNLETLRFYCAASCYGTGQFERGLELLRGILQEPEDSQISKEIPFLIELGEQQLRTVASSSNHPSQHTASNGEPRRQKSLDDLLEARDRATDQYWQHTLQSLYQRIS
jgi:tetratricopeptide (TPR) repeat protein